MSNLKSSTRALIKSHKKNFPGVKNKYAGVRQQIFAGHLRSRGADRATIRSRVAAGKFKGKPV